MGKYCALKQTKQTNTTSPQYLFQINYFSLKAVVTSLERFSNPAEHNSVELLPQAAAVLALAGSNPAQRPLSAHPSRAGRLSLHLCEPPKTWPCPLSPFPRRPLGGVPLTAKAAPSLSPLSQSQQARGRRGASPLALPGRAEAE